MRKVQNVGEISKFKPWCTQNHLKLRKKEAIYLTSKSAVRRSRSLPLRGPMGWGRRMIQAKGKKGHALKVSKPRFSGRERGKQKKGFSTV